MQDIRRVIHAAARRLLVVSMLNSVVWTVTLAMIALTLLVIADRVLILSLPWMQIFLAAVGAAIVGGMGWSLIARKRELAVARILDERAGLRESLSTALCVERAEDPWSRAVVESAAEKARRVIVRDAIPIHGPRSWPIPTTTAAVLAVIWFLMPQLDLRGALAEAKAAEDAKKQIAEAEIQARETEKQIREIMERTGVKLEDEKPDPQLEADLQRPESPDQIRKEAIRQLTNMTEQLAKKADSEEAKALESMKDLMRQLRSPGDGELSEFSRELSKGNFQKARQELEKLAEKMANGEMSAEEREKLAQQMQNLAEQLNQLAQQKDQLQQALQQAGINPEEAKQLAANPEALQQALQNNQNLSEQQKQQLQQMAQAMQQAGQQCNNMGEAMSQMASAMSQNGMNQSGQQAMDSMSGQLSSMEMLQSDMRAISQAMSQCQGQMAALGQCSGSQGWGQGSKPGPGMTGQWKPGSSMAQGSGSGGPGKGTGAGPESEATDIMFNAERPKVQNTGGPVIGSRFVYGEQIKGEATAEFAAAVEVAAEAAAEEISTMNVDPQFRGPVKHYFGRLQERVKAEQGQDAAQDAAQDGPPPSDDE